MAVILRKDLLTDLASREQLEIDLKTAVNGEDNVALALLDLDYFMEVNNNYGHEAGDRVLSGLAELLRNNFPDQAYRVSGDEFAVILPGNSLEQAFLRMEAFRETVHGSQEKFRLNGSENYEVTITIGVAQYPRDAKDASILIRVADAALGSAKENGRNQVSLPPNEEMVMKSCYYSSTMVRRLKILSDKLKKKESLLLREALSDLLRKYDRVEES
ncbi:GGDEF domain-containing protein [Paenibacillus alkalitolerans]|uniref:GGDEF domain-containing protein n=1 Tax=Paenibacillus alkalitolerans TaxID=2799335 RepID=UPI0018F60157|nr:GGDEF domain-containing protein [Paenibacillus alkalitolerans]